MRHLAGVAAVVAAGVALCAAVVAHAGIEPQVVGPAGGDDKYVVSPVGGHLATVAAKGSRMVVIVDGTVGPKVDQVITPVAAWVDPRPWADKSGNDVPKPQPVIFSNDGSRWAYVARVGQEWILMSDGKEVLRIPASGAVGGVAGIGGMEGNTDLRLQFTGDRGKHLLMARSALTGGYELWVDGQKWPGVYASGGGGSAGTVDPLVSPDGEHIAYVAQVARDKSVLLLDGKDTGYLADNLQFTADSKHLVGLGQAKDGRTLLIDGKPLFTAKAIYGVYLSPIDNGFIAVLQHQDAKTGVSGQFLLINGKQPVPDSLCDTIKKVIFSPDGKRYAAICSRSGAEWAVVDGKKGQEYQSIDAEGIAGLGEFTAPRFSPDSSKFGYQGHANGKGFIVIDDEESDGFYNSGSFIFSPDSKHVVMSGRAADGQSALLTIDAKTRRLPPNQQVTLQSFVFSPDGSRYAYMVGNEIFVDGESTGTTGLFMFSPDSKHVCITGYRAADGKHGVFVDEQLVASADNAIIYSAFTPDSQHLFWMDREPTKGPNAAPGSYQFVTYLDAKPVAYADDTPQSEPLMLPHGFGTFIQTPPSWHVGPHGTLTCLVTSGDSVNRDRITPDNTTSLAAMLGDAQATRVSAKIAPGAHARGSN